MPLHRRRSLGAGSEDDFVPNRSGMAMGIQGPRTVMVSVKNTDSSLVQVSKAGDYLRSTISEPTALGTAFLSDLPPLGSSCTTDPACSLNNVDPMELCSCTSSSAVSNTSSTSVSAVSSPLVQLQLSHTDTSADWSDLTLPSLQADDERVNNDAKPMLLTLPPEIRHQIYLHLPDIKIDHRPLIYGITPFTGRKTHSLSAVCRQIRQEVSAIFYAQNEWVVSLEFKIMYEAFRRWILHEVGEGAGSLRKLRVGVRCKSLAPKVRRRIIKSDPPEEAQQPEAAQQLTPPTLSTPPTMLLGQGDALILMAPTVPALPANDNPDLHLDGDAQMDTDTDMDDHMDTSVDGHSITSSEDFLDLEYISGSTDSDISDSIADTGSTMNSSEGSASTAPTPPEPATPEPEATYELVTTRADGDATFLVDLSEKHRDGLVNVLRTEAMQEDTESVRLVLESVVGWLWEKRRSGTLTGVDLVEGMDRFLNEVGVSYV